MHKAEDAEDPAVVIPVVTQHYAMLRRNLVYAAVTRGQRLAVVVGQPKVLAIAFRRARTRRRWSKLREWLAVGPGATGRGASDQSRPVPPSMRAWTGRDPMPRPARRRVPGLQPVPIYPESRPGPATEE